MRVPSFSRIAVALALTLFSLTACQRQPEAGQSQVIGGLRFEYGVVPATVVGTHPGDHQEATMHGGAPTEPNRYHVVVTLFNAANGVRVSDAEVALGLTGHGYHNGGDLPMDLMAGDGQASYGRYVDLPESGRYRVSFSVRRPGKRPGHIEAAFRFERPA